MVKIVDTINQTLPLLGVKYIFKKLKWWLQSDQESQDNSSYGPCGCYDHISRQQIIYNLVNLLNWLKELLSDASG